MKACLCCLTEAEGWRKRTFSAVLLHCLEKRQHPGQESVAALKRQNIFSCPFPELDPTLGFCVLYFCRGLDGSDKLFHQMCSQFCVLLFTTGTAGARGFTQLLVGITWRQMLACRCDALALHNPHSPQASFLFQFGDLTSMSPTLLDKGMKALWGRD